MRCESMLDVGADLQHRRAAIRLVRGLCFWALGATPRKELADKR
jgi:hypothetical protein